MASLVELGDMRGRISIDDDEGAEATDEMDDDAERTADVLGERVNGDCGMMGGDRGANDEDDSDDDSIGSSERSCTGA
jgi:hypothetical protein